MTRRDLVGCVMLAMVAGKMPPASTLFPAQIRDRGLSPTIEGFTRHWLDPFARDEVGVEREVTHIAIVWIKCQSCSWSAKTGKMDYFPVRVRA